MVSILITTYNSAKFLKACLESVLQQDYADCEIIIVDNASTDGTRDVLREFAARARVIYNDSNRGFAAGQNQAMAQSRGDWLFSLNPDVILRADFLSKLLAAISGDAGEGPGERPGERPNEGPSKDASRNASRNASRKTIGALSGKLLRWKPGESDERSTTIDSTGIYFRRNLRHMDRGSD